MSMVVHVLSDSNGRPPQAAVIYIGGFLGAGSRKIATDWQILHFRLADRTQPMRLALGRAAVQTAPEYKPSGQRAEIIAPTPPAPAAPDAER
jgi:hypothetical protein